MSTTIIQALAFATKAHLGQKRKYTGEDYINHPIDVADTLRLFYPKATEEMYCAALLHDVVRVRTSQYTTSRGFAVTKEVNLLKRKSDLDLYDMLPDPVEYVPLNLHEVPDGVYRLETTNISRDWESGIIDDWDVVLIPYEETK